MLTIYEDNRIRRRQSHSDLEHAADEEFKRNFQDFYGNLICHQEQENQQWQNGAPRRTAVRA